MKYLLKFGLVFIFVGTLVPSVVQANSAKLSFDSCVNPQDSVARPHMNQRHRGLNPCVKSDYVPISKEELAEMITECVKTVKEDGKIYLKEEKVRLRDLKAIRPIDDYTKKDIKELQADIKLLESAIKNPKKVCTSVLKEMYAPPTGAASRDANRLADVRQIATALELYYNDKNQYPNSLRDLVPNYLSKELKAPTPNGKGCSKKENTYTYKKIDSANYTFSFCVGQETGGLEKGNHTMTEAGIE